MTRDVATNPKKRMEETLEQVRLKLVQIDSLMLALADASYYSNWRYVDALYHVECQLEEQIKVLKQFQENHLQNDSDAVG